ncbi:MAG: PxxKW family cysteine-rich protein [Proteobacteria bacterium]|nr:PxxKW family cysteine-rich protein [Pseudomonadota bacterium]MBU1738603.1 PxxKW family cysteine-rich protein [Pseudomonadota bacterium]
MAAKSESISAEANAKYTSGLFNPVIEKCEGCERVVAVEQTNYCHTYISPEAKWKLGICNFATHVKPEIITSKIKVNPLKASKRAMAKK